MASKVKSKKIKEVNNFVIKTATVYEVKAMNDNGAGCYSKSLREAIRWARKYSWYDGSQ